MGDHLLHERYMAALYSGELVTSSEVICYWFVTHLLVYGALVLSNFNGISLQEGGQS